jgi:hypothetical protein
MQLSAVSGHGSVTKRTVAWVYEGTEKLLDFTPFCRKIVKQQNGVTPYHFLIELWGEIVKDIS